MTVTDQEIMQQAMALARTARWKQYRLRKVLELIADIASRDELDEEAADTIRAELTRLRVHQ